MLVIDSVGENGRGLMVVGLLERAAKPKEIATGNATLGAGDPHSVMV